MCTDRRTGDKILLSSHICWILSAPCGLRAFEDVQVFWRVTFSDHTNGVDLSGELVRTSGIALCRSGDVVCTLTVEIQDDEVGESERGVLRTFAQNKPRYLCGRSRRIRPGSWWRFTGSVPVQPSIRPPGLPTSPWRRAMIRRALCISLWATDCPSPRRRPQRSVSRCIAERVQRRPRLSSTARWYVNTSVQSCDLRSFDVVRRLVL